MSGSWGYICRGCETIETPEGEKEPRDKRREGINSKKTAETLARIHAIKTGHEPEVIGQ